MELLEVLDKNGKPTEKILDKNQIHKEGLYRRKVALHIIQYVI